MILTELTVAIVVPKMVERPDARIVQARHQINTFQNALGMYKLDTGNFPSSDIGFVHFTKSQAM